MAHRIFVNAGNEFYRQVTENSKGPAYGLGNPSDLGTNIGNQLGKQSGELFFTRDDLLDKRRRLQLGLENLTNPTMFVDGLLDPKVVEATIKRYQDDFEAGREINNKFFRLSLNGILVTAGLATAGGVFLVGVGTAFTTGVLINSGVGTLVVGALATGPVGWIAVAVGAAVSYVFGDWIGKHAEARAEDDAQRWTFNRRDFPTINRNVFPNEYRRSIRRLYDDRSGITKNFDDNEGIARLTREIISDVLYTKNGTLQPGHPGGGQFAVQENVFPFRKNTAGPNFTYIDAIFYISSYISLIDAILSLNDPGLSRSPDFEEVTFSTKINISLTTAKVRLYNALVENAEQVIAEKFLTFLDDKKEYKTLLNFGNDVQYSAESWRISPSATSSIQLKLFTPVNDNVQLYDRAFISREVAKTVVDNIEFQLSEEIDFSPSLRPRNTAVDKYIPNKKSINRVTLNSLNLTGSVGTTAATTGVPISYEDTVFRKWYTSNFNSSELNINFSDYTNFVSFGSAKSRIDTFVSKLTEIEDLTRGITGSVVGDALKAQEKESIIRAFDTYEQYLYYSTASIYSASAYYTETGIEYNPTGSWPKSGSILLPVTSSTAIAWYTTQSAIAERFDENNENNLVRHLPLHIQENEESTDFLTFIKMFGHVVDNLKVYVDQFPNIYSTNPDPFEELTMDQVYEVATSFGLTLPNVYSLETLQQYISETYGGNDGRSTVAETWKRFLHMMMYLYKTKGSKASLEAVLTGYGIQTPALQIKETSYPSTNTFITSDELTYGLLFTSASSSYIQIPNVSQSFNTQTLTIRFLPNVNSSSLLSGDEKWSVNVVRHPSASTVSVVEDFGRIEIISGSNRVKVASSSYFPLYSEDYTTLALRSQSADFVVMQSDGNQLLYQFSASSNIPNTLWNTTENIYIGGTGSIKTNINFDGIVDEIRAWNENVTNNNIIKQTYDPGGMYGNSYISPEEYLYVNLTFSQPLSSITQSVYNETPLTFGYTPTNINPDEQWGQGTVWDTPNGTGWQGLLTRVLTSDLTTTLSNKVSVAFPSASSSGSTQYAAKISTRQAVYYAAGTPSFISVIPGETYNISGYAYASGSTYRGYLNGEDGTADYPIGYLVSLFNTPNYATLSSQTVLTSAIGTSGWRYFETDITISSNNQNYLSVEPFIDGPWPYLEDENGNSIYGEPVCPEGDANCPGFAWFTGLEITQVKDIPAAVTIPSVGFTTSSYRRISRSVRQYIPVIGATVYSNNKVIVADPPVFNSKFIDANETKALSPFVSIKSLQQKVYQGGLNVISFAVSPIDYINQNIIRTMGNIEVNNMIGTPRELNNGKYNVLNKFFKYYKTNYNKVVNPNEYIDFYKNLAEAPAEISRTLNPAKSKLLTGIVIESPFLSRTKFNLNKSVEIGGSNTKALNNFISGSGSEQDVGVFSAEVTYDMKQNTTVLADITPLTGSLSAPPTSPSSSYLYFEAPAINAQFTASVSGGYPRYAFADEIINTPEQPFYEIPPRSDLLEYGTTSYFHKTDSVYPFQVLTPYKQKFLAILDIKPFWSISPVYGKVTLLPTGSLLTVPGRDSVEFGSQTYLAGATVDGFVNSATVFSLIGIDGEAGLRVRLYRNATYRSADSVSRPLNSPPTGDHGVLFDGLLEEVSDVMPFLLIQTENATTYFRITNTTGNDITTNIRLNYFAYEVEPLIPQGYLPRHYRFTRDNTTPLKRRNYIGCKASVGDNITDPLGRVGNSNPFYTIISDYNSIDVMNKPTNTGTTQPPSNGRVQPRLKT